MPGHDIIVIGFSAGGVEALTRMIPDLPVGFPAAILIVHHFPAHSISALPRILSRVGRLPAAQAVDGEPIRPGRIYISRPEWHLLVNGDRIQLSRGPKENGHRPAIDPLFRTAARSYGPRVIGVLLSGTLDDGADGLRVIKQCGGLAVVQRPEDALFGDMPTSAMQLMRVDYVEPAAALGPLFTRLVFESLAAPEQGVLPGTPWELQEEELLLRGTADDTGGLAERETAQPNAILPPPARKGSS